MKIAFTCPKKMNPISWLICKITKSKWSHCFIISDYKINNDNIILEANMYGGIKLNLLSKYLYDHEIEIYSVNGTNYNIEPMLKYIGELYGYFAIFGDLVAKVLHLKKNPVTLDMVCSELLLRFLLQGSLANEFKDLEPNTANPQDIYSIVINSHSFKKE